MKRFVTILLAAALALTFAVPALADMDADLASVTEHVAGLLEVPDDYTSFYGNYNDGLQPGWYLGWSKDGDELSVTCTEAGLITEVSRWRDAYSHDRFYGYDAAFPAMTEQEARLQAQDILTGLMGENEKARIDSASASLSANGGYTFGGRVMINALEGPVSFSISIGADGLASYYRSDAYKGYVGDVPDRRADVKKSEAAPLLRDTVRLELYYVSDGEEARLRYVPVGGTYVIDALTGETLDMDALYASFGGWYDNGPEAPAAMEAAADMTSARGLTEVELASIENYADAIEPESLDQTLRSFGDLGLADFSLDRCSYSMDEDGNITASLRYTCEMTADNLFGYSMDAFWDYLDWGGTPIVTKYIEADAKTGSLLSVRTNYPIWERDEAKTADVKTADRFVAEAAPKQAAESALCTLSGYNESEDSFTYARLSDGYFFPENYIRVGINAATGSVDEYTCVWDDTVAFAPAGGIVEAETALEAYTGALQVTLGYIAWPEAIDYDDPILYRYADWGYTFVESLRLAYYYGGRDRIAGIDALTGETVSEPAGGELVYDDLDGVPEREMIEALARAGVGFAGGSFRPDEALTMRDGAILLLSSAGYDVSAWDDESIKTEAVWQGFFPAADWQPDSELSRDAFLRMIIGASRYGAAAALEGIGFDSVAGALGMTDGAPLRGGCTRADGAALLYGFMSR